MKKLTNRILTLAMTLCMILSMLPMAAHATEPATYTLTVHSSNGGSATGGGTYAEGTEVTITATPDEGLCFSGWSVSPMDVALTNKAAATTTLTMPAYDVTVYPGFSPHNPTMQHDTEGHWTYCNNCEVATEKAAHADGNGDNVCDVEGCGYDMTKYTVTYTDGVEGEEIFADQVHSNLASGTNTPDFNGTPTRTGWSFDGWNPEVSTTVMANATYTAQWSENVLLTLTASSTTLTGGGTVTLTASTEVANVTCTTDASIEVTSTDGGTTWTATLPSTAGTYTFVANYGEGEEASCTVTVVEAHTHEWSEWTSDGEGNHIRVCATNSEHRQLIGCSDGSDSDELCDTCGYNMHPHNYTVFYNDDVHWEECSCGAKRNQAEHSYSDDSDSSCDCGYTRIIEHTHKWSEWTSDGEGKHIRECSYIRPHTETADCSDGADRDKLCDTCGYDLHEHIYDVVKYNNTYHWTVCICGDFEIRYFHQYANDSDATCDCGYTRLLNHEHEWSEWVGATRSHYRTCLYDNCSGYEEQDHDWGFGSTFDNICDICGCEKAVHSCVFEGGNCATESTCACGEKGEKNPSVHTGETKLVNAYEAVGLTNGYTGDIRCASCNALIEKGKVIPAYLQLMKPVDGSGVIVEEIEVAIPVDFIIDDTKVIVKEYTVVPKDIDEFGASTGLTPVPELEYKELSIVEPALIEYDGKHYLQGTVLIIDGEEYLFEGSNLVRLSDGNTFDITSQGLVRRKSVVNVSIKKTQYVIDGVVYDVVSYMTDNKGENKFYYIYLDGEPAGVCNFSIIRKGENNTKLTFFAGKDPESVKGENKYPAFSFNPPADSTIGGVDFEAGKVYNATAIAATDISVINALFGSDAAEKAARAKVEELKKKMDEAWHAYNTAGYEVSREESAALHDDYTNARSAYMEALKELEKYQVKQEVPVPAEYVGNENVSYIAVHYGELGAEIGEVAVSEDGKTLNVTYLVSDFSPFVIYAITEREEVEIQKTVLTGITIDENPTDEPTTSPQTSDNWIWYVLVAVAAGAVIVVSVIYGKRRRTKAK